jgi:Putative zinc- or iron-chelating domain
MNRAERKRQAKDDETKLAGGLDPSSDDPEPIAAMARQMLALLTRAKREKNVDPPVKYLYAKAEATLGRLKDIRVACRKGCAHCCHVWVSATPPEVLYVAKLVRRRGAMENVHAANALTASYTFSIRVLHPTPCPMLKDDACSIYEDRPVSCRFAASPDADLCRRAMREFSRETVPVPMRHLKGRGRYELATAMALREAGLPHYYYEFNAALARAIGRDDAEEAWLSGEDVFADVRRDPRDVLQGGPVPQLTKLAFG